MIESPSPLRYALGYLLWAISVSFTVFVLLQWRNSLLVTFAMTPWHRYTEGALNQFGFIILALLSLCVIVYAEHFYRIGVEKEQLFARFFRVTFVQMILLFLAHLVIVIGSIVLGLPMGLSWLISLVEGLACILLYWLYRRLSREEPSKEGFTNAA